MTPTQLPDHILSRLRGEGVTASWVVDRLGIKRTEAVQLLTAAGAMSIGGRYRFSGYLPQTYGNDRACVPAERSGVAWGSARDAC